MSLLTSRSFLFADAYPSTHHRTSNTLTETSEWSTYSTTLQISIAISVTWWFIMSAISLIALAVARFKFTEHREPISSNLTKEEAPGVSVLRPLKGIDNNLYENLASLFRLKYPKFELIFSVAADNDKAIPVVHQLMSRYSKVSARLIIGDTNVGVNPKINNLVKSYESAAHDIVWICDSNVFIDDPGCLGRSVDQLCKPGVGLVHHLPFGVRPKSLGSELELMFLNTVHAKMYLAINTMRIGSCVIGKSTMYRRSDLDKVGGLRHFGKYMAEDNLIATAIWNMGYKHKLTSDLAYQPLGSMTSADFFLRRSRWTRIRKYTVTAATIVEPLTESIFCGLFASFGFNYLWNIHPLNFFAFHIIVWFMTDVGLFQCLSRRPIDNLRGFIMAWAIREITASPLYVFAMSGSNVDWRGMPFKLRSDGTAYADKSEQLIGLPANIAMAVTVPEAAAGEGVMHDSNTAVPLPQPTLLFHQPLFVTVLSSIMMIVHIIVDILLKSQRNGQPQEVDDVLKKDLAQDVRLRVAKSAGLTRRRRKAYNDEMARFETSSTENDDETSDDELIRIARRYMSPKDRRRSSPTPNPSNPISSLKGGSPTTALTPIQDPSIPSPSEPNGRSVTPTDGSRATGSSADESVHSVETTTNGGIANLVSEIKRYVTLGLSMHLQNERNARDRERTPSVASRSTSPTPASPPPPPPPVFTPSLIVATTPPPYPSPPKTTVDIDTNVPEAYPIPSELDEGQVLSSETTAMEHSRRQQPQQIQHPDAVPPSLQTIVTAVEVT